MQQAGYFVSARFKPQKTPPLTRRTKACVAHGGDWPLQNAQFGTAASTPPPFPKKRKKDLTLIVVVVRGSNRI